MSDFWGRDDVQFPRLIAEIKAVGLTHEQFAQIGISMSISAEQLAELFDRAEETFDAFKMQIDVIETECAACGQKLLAEEPGRRDWCPAHGQTTHYIRSVECDGISGLAYQCAECFKLSAQEKEKA